MRGPAAGTELLKKREQVGELEDHREGVKGKEREKYLVAVVLVTIWYIPEDIRWTNTVGRELLSGRAPP